MKKEARTKKTKLSVFDKTAMFIGKVVIFLAGLVTVNYILLEITSKFSKFLKLAWNWIEENFTLTMTLVALVSAIVFLIHSNWNTWSKEKRDSEAGDTDRDW